MGIAERIEKLERRRAPPKRSRASQLAAVLDEARRRQESLTPAERHAEERARHEAALRAPSPGEWDSDLAKRLHAANRRRAEDWFEQCASTEIDDDAQLW